jgi:alpha-galactosidase
MMGGASGSLAVAGQAGFMGCYARWNDEELVIGNRHIERRWQIQNGMLTAISFRDLDAGCEWIAKAANRSGLAAPGTVGKERRPVSISASGGQFSPVEANSLVVEISAIGPQNIGCRFQVFPESRGVAMRYQSDGHGKETGSSPLGELAQPPTAFEQAAGSADPADDGEALEDLLLAPQHLRLVEVSFSDQTDNHNELVSEREWMVTSNERDILGKGNLFRVENVVTGAGLILLKQAPLPDSRPVRNDWDLCLAPASRRLRFAGGSDPFVVLAYRGGRNGRIEALQDYQRQVRKYDSGRDGMFLSNTWGDRSRDARINESFLSSEIAAGARLGVEVVQIDDGWQKGHSINSARGAGVWRGFWAADPHFWDVDAQRFPHGLGMLVSAARTHNMKFGLWYAPDSSQGFANWRRDADRILELFRAERIDYFKLDSIEMSSAEAEKNLCCLFDRVLRESNGKAVLDLDVTAGHRLGYFGALDTGPIFVENRYTDFHTYWPHLTLRNLWKLSQYIDPLRLRMEFLNNQRNSTLYAEDPLAPARYPPDCLFAMVMFANPLGWFETSNLPEEYLATTARLVGLWKQEKARLYSGNILPIGGAPDGVSWTGFASVAKDERSGYLLFFRELNEHSEWAADLSMFSNRLDQVAVLSGEGDASLERGRIKVRIPKPLQYLWVRVTTGKL